MSHPQTTRPPSLADDDFLLAEDIASALKIHVTSVYRLVRSGRLAAIRVGGGEAQPRGLRITRSSFEEFLNASRVPVIGMAA